jgi:hypothetical protein
MEAKKEDDSDSIIHIHTISFPIHPSIIIKSSYGWCDADDLTCKCDGRAEGLSDDRKSTNRKGIKRSIHKLIKYKYLAFILTELSACPIQQKEFGYKVVFFFSVR